MPVLKILTLCSLLFIFIQDLKYRSVYWWMFPLLTCCFIYAHFKESADFSDFWQPALINLGLIVLQLSILVAYFSIKKGKLINITGNMLGWGDILFLLCTAFYLSVLNFTAFYVSSLLLILVFWRSMQTFYKTKSVQIPLAGLQALLLGVFLAIDWYCLHFHATDDAWLLNLTYKWTG